MSKIHKCISCEREENIVPLVSITYSQTPTWICTQCLPTLIHNPDKLQDKFENIKANTPSSESLE